MISQRRSILPLTIALLTVIPIAALSQRTSDKPSVASGLFRPRESNANSLPAGYDSTGSNRSTGFMRGLIIVSKAALGEVSGIVFAVPGGFIAGQISGEKGWKALGPVLVGSCVGYALGTAVGVHVISRTQDPETSFLGALGSSVLGMGVGLAIAAASDGGGMSGGAIIILPVAFPIIYTELME